LPRLGMKNAVRHTYFLHFFQILVAPPRAALRRKWPPPQAKIALDKAPAI